MTSFLVYVRSNKPSPLYEHWLHFRMQR